MIGIDLGVSIDMVEHNLSLVRGQEHARVNLFLSSKCNPEHAETSHDDMDSVLLELLNLSKADCSDLSDSVSMLPIIEVAGKKNLLRIWYRLKH